MIRIDSLFYGYGKQMVLENLSLEIETGSTVMITGPNRSFLENFSLSACMTSCMSAFRYLSAVLFSG